MDRELLKEALGCLRSAQRKAPMGLAVVAGELADRVDRALKEPDCEHKRVLRIEGHWVPDREIPPDPVPCDVMLSGTTLVSDGVVSQHRKDEGTCTYVDWCRDCGCINLEGGVLPNNPEALYWRRTL